MLEMREKPVEKLRHRDDLGTSPGGFSSTKTKTEPKPSLVMKPIIPTALLGALLAVAHGAATDPVGYVSLGNNGAVPALTDMAIAIPLDRPAEFAGTVGSINGATITLSGTPGLTPGQFAGATPYIAKVESGTKAGMVALITANTATDITLAFQFTDSLTGVVATDQISIRKAWTVQSFFAGNTIPNFSEFGVWEGATGTDLAPDKVYYNFNGAWFDQSDDSPADNVVIYPNEGFRLRNTSNTAIANLIVSGEVPTAPSRIFINGSAGTQQDTQISYFSPVGETIGSANIGAGNFDQLLAYNLTQSGFDNAPAFTYYFFDNKWYDASDDSEVTNTLKVEGGRRYIYRAEANRADTVLSDQQSYVPGLGL